MVALKVTHLQGDVEAGDQILMVDLGRGGVGSIASRSTSEQVGDAMVEIGRHHHDVPGYVKIAIEHGHL